MLSLFLTHTHTLIIKNIFYNELCNIYKFFGEFLSPYLFFREIKDFLKCKHKTEKNMIRWESCTPLGTG
jgi:hypothetical protein